MRKGRYLRLALAVMAGAAALIGAPAGADDDCATPPDCPDKVKWAPGPGIQATLTANPTSICAQVGMGGGGTCATEAHIQAYGSDCDSWSCCGGGCPSTDHGSMTNPIMPTLEVISGPEGYQPGDYSLQDNYGDITFSASKDGTYVIQGTFSDGGPYTDECGGSGDDTDVVQTVSITVHPWQAGPAPTITVDTGVVDGGQAGPGESISFTITDASDKDRCEGAGCEADDCMVCDTAVWTVFHQVNGQWVEATGAGGTGCTFEWAVPCADTCEQYQIRVTVPDGGCIADDPDAEQTWSFNVPGSGGG